MDFSMGLNGLINIFISLVFIALSWWALQSFRFDLFFKDPKGPQVKLLQIFVSLALGHTVAGFFSDYLAWSTMLRHLF